MSASFGKNMALFKFLGGLKTSPLSDFWHLDEHDTPDLPGVYLLIAKPSVHFLYPTGRSPVFYIGQARSLRKRLFTHLTFSRHVRDDRRASNAPLYWPRYEYGGAFGARYCFIRTHQGRTSKDLEDIVLARFAKRYRSFPVANGAGAWNRIEREFTDV
jgi:hypothetical protein